MIVTFSVFFQLRDYEDKMRSMTNELRKLQDINRASEDEVSIT